MSEIRDHSRIDAATAEAVQRFMARAKASQKLPGVVVGAVLFGSRGRSSDLHPVVLIQRASLQRGSHQKNQ